MPARPDSREREVPRFFSRMSLVVLALAAAATLACAKAQADRPRSLTLLVGREGGVFDKIGASLATAYERRIPSVVVKTKSIAGLEERIDAVQRGDVEIVFGDARTSYRAYRSGTAADPKPHRKIRAIAVLFPTAVHLVARRDRAIKHVSDFRGKRIGIGLTGSAEGRAITAILDGSGVDRAAVRGDLIDLPDIAQGIRSGALDGGVFYLPFQHPLITELTTAADVQLVPIDRSRIETIQERSHFLKSMVIPRGTYQGQQGDVLAMGVDILLLCQDDLPEPLVYELTKALFDSVPELARAHNAAARIDPERGPATLIPLHPGAARYYRELELPK
jgi:uncharacterized protein